MTTLITQSNLGKPFRRCDASCHSAKGPRCVCICGGRYHGLAQLLSPAAIAEGLLFIHAKLGWEWSTPPV